MESKRETFVGSEGVGYCYIVPTLQGRRKYEFLCEQLNAGAENDDEDLEPRSE